MCFIKGTHAFSAVTRAESPNKVQEQTEKSSPDEDSKKSAEFEYSENGKELSNSTKEDEPESLGLPEKMQMLFIHNLLVHNTWTTVALLERSRQLEQTIENLKAEMEILKSQSNTIDSKNRNASVLFNPQADLGDALISQLFPTKEYRYQLVLDSPFSGVLYKQRNFDIRLKLVDPSGNEVLNSNAIPISLCAYTCDEEPKIIQENKSGQSIFKGHSETELFHGSASFHKIHIKQVTSYYKSGWVYFVIYAKQPSFKYHTKESSLEEVVDYELIKPLVISEVTVRAKKK